MIEAETVGACELDCGAGVGCVDCAAGGAVAATEDGPTVYYSF